MLLVSSPAAEPGIFNSYKCLGTRFVCKSVLTFYARALVSAARAPVPQPLVLGAIAANALSMPGLFVASEGGEEARNVTRQNIWFLTVERGRC